VKANHVFERVEATEDEAREVFANSPFKQRYISQALARGHQSHVATSAGTTSEKTSGTADGQGSTAQCSASSVAGETTTTTLSLYRCGDFVDLCRGPHVASTGVIGDIALLSANASVWDPAALREVKDWPEGAPAEMQRVHGVAFAARDGVCGATLAFLCRNVVSPLLLLLLVVVMDCAGTLCAVVVALVPMLIAER
jgi:hypothetical protein